MDSSHFVLAAPVIADSLASFFLVVLQHGFLLHQLTDCVLVPFPEPGTLSDSYCPIALATSLSMVP